MEQLLGGKDGATVIMCGHSLGGSQAVVLAYELAVSR